MLTLISRRILWIQTPPTYKANHKFPVAFPKAMSSWNLTSRFQILENLTVLNLTFFQLLY